MGKQSNRKQKLTRYERLTGDVLSVFGPTTKEIEAEIRAGSILHGAENLRILEEPSIYVFRVPGIDRANMFITLKVGDTGRDVYVRLQEWMEKYPALELVGYIPAYVVDEKTGERRYFRDYVVHEWLREHGYVHLRHHKFDSYEKLLNCRVNLPEDVAVDGYLSNEFFVNLNNPTDPTKAVTMELLEEFRAEVAAAPEKFNLMDVFSASGLGSVNYRELEPWVFTPYQYQINAVKELTDKQRSLAVSQSKEPRTLLASGTGSGKSMMLMLTVKALIGASLQNEVRWEDVLSEHKTVNAEKPYSLTVVTSYLPDVFDEIRQALERHVYLRDDFYYLTATDLLVGGVKRVQQLHDEGYHNIVVGVSLQNLAGRVDVENLDVNDELHGSAITELRDKTELKKIHHILQELGVDLVLGDEAHLAMFGEGALEYRAALSEEDEVLHHAFRKNRHKAEFTLSPRLGYLFATGTEQKLIAQGAIPIQNTVFVSKELIEEQAEKSNTAAREAGDESTSPHFGRPVEHYVGLDIFDNFQADQRSGLFLQRAVAKATMKAMFGLGGQGKNVNTPPIFADKLLRAGGAGRHILWQTQTRLHCDLMSDLFLEVQREAPEHHFIKEYRVYNVSSERSPRQHHNVRRFKQELHRHRFTSRTVTFTVNRFTTGVSINQWDTVIVGRGGTSLAARQQIYGRVVRSWVETAEYNDGSVLKTCYKPNAFILDLCAGQLFSIVNESELTSRTLDGSVGGSSDDSSERRPYIGNVYVMEENVDGGEMVLSACTAQDTHRLAEEYVRRSSIRQGVENIPTGEELIEAVEPESLFGYINSKPGSVLEARTLNVGEELHRQRVLVNPEDSTYMEKLQIEGGEGCNIPASVPHENEDEELLAVREAARQHEEMERRNRILIVEGCKVRLLLAGVLRRVDGEGHIIESLPQLLRTVENDVAFMERLHLAEHSRVISSMVDDKLFRLHFDMVLRALVLRCEDGFDEALQIIQELNRISSNEVFTVSNTADVLVGSMRVKDSKNEH